MARKRTLDRRALRDNAEAAEARQRENGDEEGEEVEEVDETAEEDIGDEEEAAPKPKKKPAKAPARPRTRTAKVVRMKMVWGVFNGSNQKVETFPYNQKAQAEAYIAEKMADKKQLFFLQPIKEPLEDK